MKKTEPKSKKNAGSRRRVEKDMPRSVESIAEISPIEMEKVIHELHVHQVELETQNEQLRQAQMEATEARQKYADLYDFAPVGYFTFDRKGHIIEANVTGASLLGEEKRSLAKQPFQRFIAPEHFSIFQSHLQKAHETRSKQVCELKLTGKDGTTFDALIDTIAVTDGEGKFHHYRSSVTDITEISGAEAFRETEERYRALAYSADSMYLVDRECRYQFMNDAHLLRLGVSLDQVKGRSYGDFHSEEDLKQFAATIEAVFETGKSFQTEHYGRMDDSFFLRTFSPVKNSQGNITAVTVISKDSTERKQAEEALRQSEERFRQLADATFEGIVIHDKGELLDFNQAMLKMFDYDHDEVIGKKNVMDFIAPESRELVLQHIATGSEKPYEVMMVKKDGNTLAMEVAGKTISYKGRMARVVALRDITERKRAEEALRESEEKYRAIIENMQEGYHEVDINGNFTFFNESTCKILGYEREELLGMNNRQYSDDKNARKVYQVYNRVYRTGAPANNFEWQIIRKDGGRRDVEVSVSLIRDAEGQPTGFRGIVRDTTDRKLAEEKLRESEEQYRLLFENANEVIFIAQDGVIKFANSKTIETMGYTAEELASIPFIQHIHPEDRDMVVERHKKRLQGESLQHVYSFRVINRFGEELWFEVNAVCVDWEGRPASLNLMRNITEQRRLEAQLLVAQKMEAIGTLAGGLAHDFNNLLSGILGNASLAKTGMDPSDQNYGRLQNIETIVESAARLTRQLLAFSRRGRIDVRTSDINEIIYKTADIFSRTNKDVTIHRNLDKDLCPAEVDRGQMEQALLNLFVNAWQAMPGGGNLYLDTVNIVLTETDLKHPYMKPGRYVKVSVTDTGTGMDEKTQSRIFEPFFTTKEMGRGTGLGLAMVYGIIKGHNGYINVHSELGHGTTFSIYLPASEKGIPQEAPHSQDVLRGTETILIVDDEQMNLNVSKEILESLGYTVYTASRGTEALALYTGKKGEIDLIILDMIMPGMSGGDTYDRIKELNSDIRVILCSGYSIDGDAQKVMDRGCNGFIQKPFNLTDISQKIREVLDKKT